MAETFDPHCVWFVGAGPGDRELITLKGYRLLQQAQVVIYAGSLINTELLAYCPPQAECHDSAALHLEQILDLMEAGVKAGKTVVRLQTGDVSLYGSVREQGEELTRRGIRWQVVPGVSAFLGAAAELADILQSGVLAPVCGTKFTRIRAMLHLDGCVCELAGDIGELSRGTRRAPLCELELELKDGEAAPMLAFGRALAEKFGLREEHSSKSERARQLEQV